MIPSNSSNDGFLLLKPSSGFLSHSVKWKNSQWSVSPYMTWTSPNSLPSFPHAPAALIILACLLFQRIHKAHSWLRMFTLSISSKWNVLLKIHMFQSLTYFKSLLSRYLLGKDFHSTWLKISDYTHNTLHLPSLIIFHHTTNNIIKYYIVYNFILFIVWLSQLVYKPYKTKIFGLICSLL